MDPQQGPPQPDLLIGQTIGNYLVTQKLGEGGMGSVYLAEHPSIGKKVALKVLHSEFSTNQEVAARFFHEAKAVNDIGHPNIVDIVDFGIIQAGPGREQLVYFIMEYLAGVTLSHLIRTEAPLAPERALMIALQVADALSASHKCGIVHRDLKPDNIILLQRGRERDFVKLLDFGIAKLTGGSAVGSHRTRTGIVMGTPAYMSPEQCEGRDSVDLRTDVYALGIVLYEMVTGRVPFIGEGYGEILVQHLTQRPRPPSQIRMLPPHVEVVVLKALEKRADMRFPTMEEFMRAMSDPVGYVEAHGGVGAFLQRQLTPSNAPVTTSLRLTPTPPTPLPGTLIAPSMSGVAPGMPSTPGMSMPAMSHVGIATPSPTTLGSATGQIQRSGSKAGFILAALVVVAAAIAAIIVVAGKTDQQIAGPGSEGEGSGVAVVDPGSGTAISGTGDTGGTGTESGTTGTGTTGTGTTGTGETGTGTTGAGTTGTGTTGAGTTGTGTTGTGTTGTGTTGTGTTGTGTTGTGTAGTGETGTGTGTTGTGTGTTGTGTATSGTGTTGTGSTEVIANSDIDVISVPSGAHVLVDGVDTGKTTPTTLHFPKKKGTKISITLRLKGYSSHTFRSVDTDKNSQQRHELTKVKTGSTTSSTSGNSNRPSGSGTKSGSAARGSGDPDGLMPP
jgi:serine/threonine protein kinase